MRLPLTVIAACLALALYATPANAYTIDDTLAAIDAASAETGVSASWLRRVVYCETGGTLSPSVIGDHGTSFGAAQLHRGGLLGTFYAQGFGDPFNPYEAIAFMAYQFLSGNSFLWTCN
jgi:hypothetical protein